MAQRGKTLYCSCITEDRLFLHLIYSSRESMFAIRTDGTDPLMMTLDCKNVFRVFLSWSARLKTITTYTFQQYFFRTYETLCKTLLACHTLSNSSSLK